MKIKDEKELREAILNITEQVIKRIKGADKSEGTLALIPSYVSDAVQVKKHLREKYGENVILSGDGAAALDEGFRKAEIETHDDRQRLIEALKNHSDIVLVTPPLWIMKNIARGNDKGFFEQIFIQALLWGKKVSVMLDFDKPKPKNSAFFKELDNDLSAIADMGAEIVWMNLPAVESDEGILLVTESEVIDAHKRGKERIKCASGAIVTPLARDSARELEISIER